MRCTPRSWANGAFKAKRLHGLGGQVMEIVACDASGTYRAIYTVSIGESIYVLHAFQKKSKAGIATPKSEMELIRLRLKQLRSEVKNAEKRGPYAGAQHGQRIRRPRPGRCRRTPY